MHFIEGESGIGKKGQVAIFVIIAILIVAGIAIFFFVRERARLAEIPADLLPIFEQYSQCIEDEARGAIDLAGSQGGRVYLTDYIPGSEYAPSSNNLNFLGFPVPYWYYISGNGIIKEQVPGKQEMQNEIARYVRENVNRCNFDSFYTQGFSISFKEPDVKVSVQDEKVSISMDGELVVSKGESVGRKTEFTTEVNSKLGKFYNLALEIYNKEKNDAFLENYSADVLRLYAPVDGVDITCSPRIWKTQDVLNEVKQGLEANIEAIKLKGNYYQLNNPKNNYFVVDKQVDESVNLIYSRNWPTKFEVTGEGVDNELMIAEPVGNQKGLGIMGFCYVPYHFVYDLNFPVLIQVYNNEEVFQFPVVVVIDKNVPRNAVPSVIEAEENFDLCEFKTQPLNVNLYDVNLNPVDANISYNCFEQICRLGESKNGVFTGNAPACINGYIVAQGSGFSEKKELFSTNEQTNADIILDREYQLEVSLEVGGEQLQGTAVVAFSPVDSGTSTSVALPEVKNVRLSEGKYEVRVYVYGNSSVVIPATTKTQCTDVAESGLLGLFGKTKEKCFDIVIPETKIDYALVAGGKSEVYLLPGDLESGKINIKVDKLPTPNSLEQLQYNFEAFENTPVDISFG